MPGGAALPWVLDWHARPLPCRVACSPRDKRIVREPDSEHDVWWGEGSPNYEMDER